MRYRIAFVVLAGCGSSNAGGALAVQKLGTAPRVAPCEPSPEPPPLDAAFAPTVSGDLSLITARGDVRFSSTRPAIPTWSADGAQVAFLDNGRVSVWRVADGALIDSAACPGPAIAIAEFAFSPDLRWFVVSGKQRTTGDPRVTCIFDRQTRVAHIVDGKIESPAIEGGAVVGSDRALDLASGAAVAIKPRSTTVLPPAGLDTEGATQFAVSPDGRYLAGWTGYVVDSDDEENDDDGRARGHAPPPRPQFLAVWDRATGKRRWRDPSRCCEGWQFSADSRYLEAPLGRGSTEVIRAASGAVVSFPYPVSPMAPDGRHLFVFRSHHMELWDVDPPRPALRQPRTRLPLRRSRDGRVTVALHREGTQDRLAIERAGRCIDIDIALARNDAVELSADGEELYLGIDGGGRPPGAVMHNGVVTAPELTSKFLLWRTATGELERAIAVQGARSVYVMPAAGRVGFSVDDGIEIFDAHTGRTVMRARAPRLRTSAPDAHGTRWGERDDQGDRFDQLTGPVIAIADGMHLVGGDGVHGSWLSIWDLVEPRRAVELPGAHSVGVGSPLAIAPDEAHVAAGAADGAIGLWTRHGTAIPVRASHAGAIESVAFSQDGRRLASGGSDGIVIVSATATGAELGRVALVADQARFLWWSPDHQLTIGTARGFSVTVTAGTSR